MYAHRFGCNTFVAGSGMIGIWRSGTSPQLKLCTLEILCGLCITLHGVATSWWFLSLPSMPHCFAERCTLIFPSSMYYGDYALTIYENKVGSFYPHRSTAGLGQDENQSAGGKGVRILSRGVARRRHIASADISYSIFISKRSFSGDFDDAFRNVMFSLSAE